MTATADDTRHLQAVPDAPRVQFADLRAEQAALGAMMASNHIADQIIEIVTSGDFYNPNHGRVYATIAARLAAGEPNDPITLSRALAESGDLTRIGGATYLFELIEAVPTAANGPHYARIVADWATRRRLRETAVRLDQYSADLTRDISDIVNAAQQVVHDATTPHARSAAPAFGELVDGTLAEIFDPAGPQRGLSTGIGALDDVIGGLKPGQLVIVAARPGVGKSILTTGFARFAAMKANTPSTIFSLEMSQGELMRRILSSLTGVFLTKLLHGGLTEHDRGLLRDRAADVRAAPLRIDDTRQTDIVKLSATARRLQQRHGLGLIVVDYLQLMSGSSGGRDNRATEVGEISRGLKLLAGDLGVPVVAAAQLNRLAEQRPDKRPQLSDLRESGSIEQDADIVILLHRPDYQNPEHERSGEIDLIVAKNRNGPEETVTASAQLDRARIVDHRTPR